MGRRTLEVISNSSSGDMGDRASRGVVTNNIPTHLSTPTHSPVRVTRISLQVTSSLHLRVTTVASLVTPRVIAPTHLKGMRKQLIRS